MNALAVAVQLYRTTTVHVIKLTDKDLGRDDLAETSLMGAVNIEPHNLDYLYALANRYLKQGRWERARETIARHPDQNIGHDIADFVRRRQ